MMFSRMPDGVVMSFDRGELAQVKTMMFKYRDFFSAGGRYSNEIADKIGDYFVSIHSNNLLVSL